jgi:elongation factor Ts
MPITSEMVRDLRERTGAGLMECKRALEASQGNFEAAVDHLRKQGLKTADKKAERETGEGRLQAWIGPKMRVGSMVALTCETDFVARTSDFGKLLYDIAELVAEKNPANVDALAALPLNGGSTVGDTIKLMVGKIGENIKVPKIVRLENMKGRIGSYVHHDGKKAAIVSVTTEADEDQVGEALKELCQHIVVFNPAAARRDQVPPEAIEREKAVYLELDELKSKPPEIREKIVAGKLEKFLAEQVLPEQKWMKDDSKTVQKIVEEKLGKGSRIEAFARFQIGK